MVPEQNGNGLGLWDALSDVGNVVSAFAKARLVDFGRDPFFMPQVFAQSARISSRTESWTSKIATSG